MQLGFVTLLQLLLMFTSSAWLVKRKGIPHFPMCQQLCNSDLNCSSWTIDRNPDRSVTCYLESPVFERIKEKFPNVFKRSSIAASGHQPDVPWKKVIKVENIVRGPVAFDSTTILNFERHFLHGCSYTISMWAWIWRQRNMPPAYEAIPLLSTISSDPHSHEGNAVYPAVLFNVGSSDLVDRYFFSGSLDSNGFATGVWGSRRPAGIVEFNRWTHITLTINDTTIVGYIDGKEVEYLKPFRESDKKSCPYANWTYDQANDSTLLHNTSESDKHSNNTNMNELISNTILRIGGQRGQKSMVGFVQDVIIVSNAALLVDDINLLMKTRPAVKLPTMSMLMNDYEIFSLENYCVKDWRRNFYLMWSWGLCPDIVCGAVCLSEAFLLGKYDAVTSTGRHSSSSMSSKAIDGVTRLLLNEIGQEYISTLLTAHDVSQPSELDLHQVSMDLFGISLMELETVIDAYYDDEEEGDFAAAATDDDDDYMDDDDDVVVGDDTSDDRSSKSMSINDTADLNNVDKTETILSFTPYQRENETIISSGDMYNDLIAAGAGVDDEYGYSSSYEYDDQLADDVYGLDSIAMPLKDKMTKIFGNQDLLSSEPELDYYGDDYSYMYDDSYDDAYGDAYADAYMEQYGVDLDRNVQGAARNDLTFEQLRRKHVTSGTRGGKKTAIDSKDTAGTSIPKHKKESLAKKNSNSLGQKSKKASVGGENVEVDLKKNEKSSDFVDSQPKDISSTNDQDHNKTNSSYAGGTSSNDLPAALSRKRNISSSVLPERLETVTKRARAAKLRSPNTSFATHGDGESRDDSTKMTTWINPAIPLLSSIRDTVVSATRRIVSSLTGGAIHSTTDKTDKNMMAGVGNRTNYSRAELLLLKLINSSRSSVDNELDVDERIQQVD